jgi:hypothetical protein
MARKLNLGWGRPDEFSLCEGDIFNDASYKGYLICWANYKKGKRTYLIRTSDESTFCNSRIIPLDIIKNYLDKRYGMLDKPKIIWRRIMRKIHD